MKMGLKIIGAMLTLTVMLQAKESTIKKAHFAGGCFWGVEYYMEALKGVKNVVSGFMGGSTKNPTYEQVVYTKTGHIETVEVTYDSSIVSYEAVCKRFFEIHDFTDVGGQGPDRGDRYESYVFYGSAAEKEIASKLIKILTQKGYKVATKLRKASAFYEASTYHQNYYQKHHRTPYCHAYKKIFN